MNYNNFNPKEYLKSNFPKLNKKSTKEKKEAYLLDVGIIPDKSGYKFECNQFARFFLKYTTIISLNNNELAIYKQTNGYYVVDSELIIKKIIKYMLNLVSDEWNWSREKSAYESIKRDVITTVDGINDGDFINVQNGLLSLKDFTLYQHTDAVFTTSQLPISYTPSPPDMPIFTKFLSDITMGDTSMQMLICEAFGYALSNSIAAQKAFFLVSSGSSGKSTLMNVLQKLVGEENCSHTPLSSFNGSFGLAQMVGCTVNIASENNACRINSEIFKAIVGGDKMEVNIKYKPALNVCLNTKIFALFNELPESNDLSFGYFRRLIIIPFQNRFIGDNVDVNILDKMYAELPSILHWAVEGLKRLQKNNYQFTDCEVCRKALEDYRNSVNTVGGFFESNFSLNNTAIIRKSDIYKIYEAFCTENSYEVLQVQKFWRNLKQHFANQEYHFTIKKVKGVEYMVGFSVKRAID